MSTRISDNNSQEDTMISKLREMKFDDGLGNLESFEYHSHYELTGDRKLIYVNGECFQMNDQVYGVKYVKPDGKIIEHILLWNGTDFRIIYCECGISYEPLSPSGLVEYQYDPDGPWRLAKISLEPLEAYKASKFTLWRGMLDKPSCEAAFARLLQSGAINRIYDKLGFPIPEEEQAAWRITDENTGKLVDIPRPVHQLRIWNPTNDCYDEISALLGGAPSDLELQDYWLATLEEMKGKHGEEYIQALLNRGR